ncbi:MAG: DUF47 family protein [Desulfurococcaceae archaeon]|nr:DUF47 family protein [Desulfurococcaceae archaeon]
MSEESGALVEMTAIEEIINICRIVGDELSSLAEMLRRYHSEDVELGKLYERVREIKKKGEENYIRVMQYLVKSSEVALYVPIYINIVRNLDKIIQQVDAVAYRIYLARENNIVIDKNVVDTFLGIISLESKQVQGIEEALSKIRLSPKVVLDKLETVFSVEEEVDSIYRKSLFEVYAKYSGYITALLILRDIFEHLEEISDFLKNTGEELRYLALARRT